VPPTTQLDPGFVFRPIPPLDNPIHLPFPALPSPLGPLELLAGTWNGQGFNTIWRPHFPSSPQDRFLELNLTTETLSFNPISGAIPNRGLLQEDMNMFGLTYMQQISDSSSGDGLHIEPGIWAAVPQTADPAEQPTVVRMASIPHGTTILAQGVASVLDGGPTLPDNNLIPFGIGGTPPPNGDFLPAAQTFTEMDLSVASTFRSLPLSGVTQDMVKNPNSILQAAISGQSIRSTTTLQVSTSSTPVPGGVRQIPPSCKARPPLAATPMPRRSMPRFGSRPSRTQPVVPTPCSCSTPRRSCSTSTGCVGPTSPWPPSGEASRCTAQFPCRPSTPTPVLVPTEAPPPPEATSCPPDLTEVGRVASTTSGEVDPHTCRWDVLLIYKEQHVPPRRRHSGRLWRLHTQAGSPTSHDGKVDETL